MAIIAMPTSPGPNMLAWRLISPAQENVSQWTGARQVLASGRGWFECQFGLPTFTSLEAFHPWASFLAQMSNKANTCRIRVFRRAQTSFGQTVRVAGGGQTGRSIQTDGWAASQKVLVEGQYVTIDDQLLQLTSDVDTNGSGVATIRFEPPIRSAPANDTVIEYENPTALMTLIEAPLVPHAPHGIFTVPVLQFREAF